jgi:hypothetical protein
MGVLNDGALAVKPVNGDIFNNWMGVERVPFPRR